MRLKGLAIIIMIALLIFSGCSPVKKVTPEDTEKKTSQEQTEERNDSTTLPEKSRMSDNDSKEDKTETNVVQAAEVKKGYFVRVDISEQKVYVFKDGKLIKSMVCSTGIPGKKDSETPVGSFSIDDNGKKRGEWFYSSEYKEGAKYFVGFIGTTFLFHSVPMDKNGNIIKEEADKLGTPASHGCIRLSLDDAKWFYTNIPSNTKLIIQK